MCLQITEILNRTVSSMKKERRLIVFENNVFKIAKNCQWLLPGTIVL